MNKEIIEDGKYRYIETSPGKDVLMLLHGLLGELSNFGYMIDRFGDEFNVVTPILPIMQMPLKSLGLKGMVKYIEEFVEYKSFDKVHVMGNSLGGHLAQLFTLANSDKVKSMTLTGSSGLFENAMGNTFPKRGDYDFIKKKAEMVFYDPAIATKELVDEVYETVNDRSKAIRIVVMAKSAVRNNLEDKIHLIENPTLLVWGKQDDVTPPFVADKFHELLPNSKLYFIDKCGHAPMMERPEEFNDYLAEFLKSV